MPNRQFKQEWGMSKDETQLLKELGLRHSVVARAIGASRQAVTKGLNKHQSYMTEDRIGRLYEYLLKQEPVLAESLRERAIEELNIGERIFSRYGLQIEYNKPEETPDFNELWVFSCRPLELNELYRSQMRKFYRIKEGASENGSTSSTERRIIAYFIPSDIVPVFKSLLEIEFSDLSMRDRANVQIIQCDAIQFVPHFVIFEPRSDDPRGKLAIAGENNLMAMPHDQTVQIRDALRRQGVGVDKDNLVVPISSNAANGGMLAFEVVFSSLDTESLAG